MLRRTDISPYWFFALVAFVLVSLAPPLAAAPPTIVPTGVAAGEHISAVAFPDAATVVLAIARDDGSGSRLAVWTHGKADRSIPLGNFSVNRLEFVSQDRLVASGAVAGETYVTRVYRTWRRGSPDLVWDSAQVPIPLGPEEGTFHVSPDGRYWGLLKPTGDETLEIHLGRLPEHESFFHVELEEEPPRPLPITTDFPRLVFLDSPGPNARFALAWQGRVRILEGAAPATRAMVELGTDPEPQGLHWADGRLWIESRKGIMGVEVPLQLPQSDQIRHLSPAMEISRQELGFAPAQVVPRPDGTLAAVSASGAAGPPEVRVVHPGGSPTQLAVADRRRLEGYFRVIPSAHDRLAVGLPDGWESPVMHLLRF